MQKTGDPALDLLAAVYKQAIADARRGDYKAIFWLDSELPEWRRYTDGGNGMAIEMDGREVVADLGVAHGVQLPVTPPAVDESERAKARRQFAYEHGVDPRYLPRDFRPGPAAEAEQVDDAPDIDPESIAARYGVQARYVLAISDPEAERELERQRIASAYGVDVRYVKLPGENES